MNLATLKISKEASPDHDMINEWVHKYTDVLYQWAFFRTNRKEIAEDLVQETFISAHKSMDTFRKESSPGTWLMAIL